MNKNNSIAKLCKTDLKKQKINKIRTKNSFT